MPKLSPFAISGLLITVSYLPLFFFLIIRGKNTISRVYSLHILSVGIWGIGSFLVGISPSENFTLQSMRFGYFGVLFLSTFFFHSVSLLTGFHRKLILPVYLQTIFFAAALLSGKIIIKPIFLIDGLKWTSADPFWAASVIIWLCIVFLGHFDLFRYYLKCHPKQRKQILALILAVIGFMGGGMSFLPNAGIVIYPLGNFLIPIHSFIVTYAILKHQLLDIKIVYKQGLVYSILIFLITIVYLVVVMTFEKLLEQTLGYNSILISLGTAFLLGIIFFPLRNRIQEYADRLFFQRSPTEIAAENLFLKKAVTDAEKHRAVATFTSGLAHEVKNPLTAIKTFTEFLPEKLDDKEFLRRFARIVSKETARIDDLVTQMLDFARPVPLQLKPVAINKFIGDSLDFLNSHFLKSHITVEQNTTSTEGLMIQADPSQLRQALLNILLNAVDAMPDGGTLRVETRLLSQPTMANVRGGGGLPKSDVLELRVTDTGVGIPRDQQDHILDPFFTTKDTGTGLGLPITAGIIENHSGRLAIKSQEGRGTSVMIQLPVG